MRGYPLLLCFLLPLVGCAPKPDAADKRWTLPIKETAVTTDLLSGQVVSRRENTYRYDEQNRHVYQSHTANGILQSETTNFVYDGLRQIYRQIIYDDGQAYDYCVAEVLYTDSSLLHISRQNMRFETNEADNITLEYTYDAENRPVEMVCSTADTIHSIQKTVYEPRRVHRTHTDYDKGEWHAVRTTDITYADDVLSMPLREQYTCVFSWDTAQKYTTTTTYHYNRRGLLSGKKVWENGVHISTCDSYRYNNKKLVYTYTEYGDGKSLRRTETTIDYK